MTKYRKKTVIVDAYRVSDAIKLAHDDWWALPEWVLTPTQEGRIIFISDHILINTLEGQTRADYGDWIIKGISNELYPCKPDVFALTYEVVDESP